MFDIKLQEATGPVLLKNDQEAVRAFQSSMTGHKYPEDQQLWFIGEFNEDAPCISGLAQIAKQVHVTVDTIPAKETPNA